MQVAPQNATTGAVKRGAGKVTFKERCNKLSKKLKDADKQQHKILQDHYKTPQAPNLKGKAGQYKRNKDKYRQCYKPLGKCNSQVLCWGNVYCTEETPNCLSIKEVKT